VFAPWRENFSPPTARTVQGDPSRSRESRVSCSHVAVRIELAGQNARPTAINHEGGAGDVAGVVVGGLSNEKGAKALIDAAVKAHGKIDNLVLNAGIVINGTVTDIPLSDWQSRVDTNLTANFLLAKYDLRKLDLLARFAAVCPGIRCE